MSMQQPSEQIRVKFLTAGPAALWLHQMPDNRPLWGKCRFIFDQDATDYDWLVVYDDVPVKQGLTKNTTFEEHPGGREKSLLVTTEPCSIKYYGQPFVEQFGCVLTSQDANALRHRERIFSQPALQWFYGVGTGRWLPFNSMLDAPPEHKTQDLSMVYSPKAMRFTLHKARKDFMLALIRQFPEMAVFGRGALPLDDKAEALDGFRYHIAIENHVGLHHWTEKLADAFLGLALPFYDGCPNAEAYFPAESFIRIDKRDPEQAVAIIRNAIANKEYEKRLPAIREARRRVLFEYNLFAVLAHEIEARNTRLSAHAKPGRILSRHALRRTSKRVWLDDLQGKLRMRVRNLLS